jgi:hypothetical protein
MVAVNQTITIVNKGGKIVSTSKHLVNVFTEAKGAYYERKAEIKVQRRSEHEAKKREKEARRQFEALALENGGDDAQSKLGPTGGSDNGRAVKRKPVPIRADRRSAGDRGPLSPLRHEGLAGDDAHGGELVRRNTDGMQSRAARSTPHSRRTSLDGIDMDLAYGDLPPHLAERNVEGEVELREKMDYLQRLLDEGNCIQHSVTAMIDNLQKNPDALAAVALTLAEISNLAAKMAPGVLTAMKSSFPAVLALLASPQFAIAAGVGVGVTIIALGGYKIIKKIKANSEEQPMLEVPLESRPVEGPEEATDQLRELDRIERWRRGIADVEADSMGTSVDGEYITPLATRTLIEEGRLTEADFKPLDSRSEKKHRKKKTKSEVSSRSKASSRAGSEKVKVKTRMAAEPSMLRSLFKGRS